MRAILTIMALVACTPLEALQPDATVDASEDAEPTDVPRDSGLRDFGSRDTGIQPDSGLHLDAEPDAGEVDTGEVDTGEVDTGEVDTGEVEDAAEADAADDAGEADAAEADAEVDAAVPDAGLDAGLDAGSCADVVFTSSVAYCQDFNTGTSTSWVPEGGSWSVAGGTYVGTMTSTAGSTCGETLITGSMFQDAFAQDVAVHLDMIALVRADKVLILRGVDPSNRIEINFRAEFSRFSQGDLVLQEIETCTVARYTEVHTVLIPHQIGQQIHVDVTLIGDELTVIVDGGLVLTSTYAFAGRIGQIGVGAITGGTALFDNIVIEVLDP